MYQSHYSHRPPSLLETLDFDTGYEIPNPHSPISLRYSPHAYPRSPIQRQQHIMKLEAGEWTSIYIPYLDSSYTREYLTYTMEVKYCIGKVSRIDFVSLSKMHGGADDVSAFVHFEVWYNNEFTQFLRHQLEKYNKYNLSHFYRYFSNLPNISNYLGDCDHFVLMINRSQATTRRTASISTLSSDENELAVPSMPSLRRDISISSNLETMATVNSHSQYMVERIEKYERRVELLEDEVRALRDIVTKYHLEKPV
jgi:hypothetical protein